MKVVVDIPNWLYDAMMGHREPIYSQSLGDAVRDGTPLDDVKAEISRKANSGQWSEAVVYGMAKAVAIIDNIGKAESED